MSKNEIMTENDDILELEDENGQPIKVKIYQSYHSEKFNKDIVFIEYVDDDNPDVEIEAFYYDEASNALCALNEEEYLEAEEFFKENNRESDA